MSKVTVVQNEEKPSSKEVLAESIVKISAALKALSASGLNRKAIIVLVKNSTGLGHGTVDVVLCALEQLKADYCW